MENRVLNATDQSRLVTVVSGLPRSGTSMMMRMLAAGGMSVLADEMRAADEYNPRGYYEYEPATRTRQDSHWLHRAEGRVVKIVYKLLYDLPPSRSYRIIMMKRRLAEVVASQNAMLRRLSESADGAPDDARLVRLMRGELSRVLRWLRGQPNFSVLEVDYNCILADPQSTLERVDDFVGPGLDLDAMRLCIEPLLYRRRRSE